jgi:predicted oxidoreductase
MNNVLLNKGEFEASEIVLGCMRIAGKTVKEVDELINTALNNGINFFDHADVYGGGVSEELFAKSYTGKRENIIIQTKCGICKGYFDFSKEHILKSVDGSLKRLKTEYIDILLLHRPDALIEPEEVAEAFDILHSKGKVKAFGVSNQNPMQIKLLSKYVKQKLIVNQLQLSITNTTMIDAGLNVNMEIPESVDRDGSILDFCRLEDITIQAWSPFQYGFFEGVFLDNDKFRSLNDTINKIAIRHSVDNTAIAVSFILRHPAKMQVIVGTTNSKRLDLACKASSVYLSRQEWYEIYCAAGNKLP